MLLFLSLFLFLFFLLFFFVLPPPLSLSPLRTLLSLSFFFLLFLLVLTCINPQIHHRSASHSFAPWLPPFPHFWILSLLDLLHSITQLLQRLSQETTRENKKRLRCHPNARPPPKGLRTMPLLQRLQRARKSQSPKGPRQRPLWPRLLLRPFRTKPLSTSRGDINIKSRGAKVDATPVSSFRTSPKSRDYDSNRLAAKSTFVATTSIPTTPTPAPVPVKDQFDIGRCTRWFESFTGLEEEDIGSDQIGPAGISQLCEDIGVSLEAIDMLVLAFHLNADTMPFFSKDEWTKGMKKLEVDSTIKLKASMPRLVAKLKNPVNFKEFYRYIFMFVKNSEQKCMDVETACRMLETVMAGRPHTKSFVAFLEAKKPVKVINKDQWYNFLDFSESVSEDLSNYDGVSSAWPVLMDEYVEWRSELS